MLATYGFHDGFDFGYPNLGVAAMMSALPVLIPLVILLMRRVRSDRGAAMSIALTAIEAAYRPRLRRRRRWTRVGSDGPRHRAADLDAAASLQHAADRARAMTATSSPASLAGGSGFRTAFASVWNEDYWYLEHFWHQFGNSIYMGVATMVLTVLIGSLASFALGRMRLAPGPGWSATSRC